MSILKYHSLGRGHLRPQGFTYANLNPLVPKMFLIILKSISASSSSKKDFQSFFLYKPILNYVPLGWGHLWPQELYFCKLESLCPKGTSYQISMHSASGSWEEDFLSVFLYMPIYITLSPSGRTIYDPMNFICENLSQLGWSLPNNNAFEPVVLEKKIF